MVPSIRKATPISQAGGARASRSIGGRHAPEPLAGSPGAAQAVAPGTRITRAHSCPQLLETISRLEAVDAVFHAAALCDYRVEQVLSAAGKTMTSRKFATRDGRLHLVLAPALKVLPKLRGWFPEARLVGWKYELAGTRDDAFSKAWAQLRACHTDACVLNGAAYGDGFALCQPDGQAQRSADSMALFDAFTHWLSLPRRPGRGIAALPLERSL